MRNALIVTLKVIALGMILAIVFVIAAGVAGITSQPAGQQQPTTARAGGGGEGGGGGGEGGSAGGGGGGAGGGNVLLLIFAVNLAEAAVLAYFILHSRWSGWKLTGAIFLAFYGLNTVIAQIESVVYLPRQLPAGMIPKLFLMGAIVAAVFSPLAVLILGKMRRRAATTEEPPVAAAEWAWKLTLIPFLYVVIYYTFGYYIAWRTPEVRAYYGGTDPGSFFAQLGGIWSSMPWMYALQIARGLLWIVLALPAIRMLDGAPWKKSIAAAFLFAIWSAQLLFPNPFMPEAVAHAHLIETVSSNALFGLIAGWLLSARLHSTVSPRLLHSMNEPS